MTPVPGPIRAFRILTMMWLILPTLVAIRALYISLNPGASAGAAGGVSPVDLVAAVAQIALLGMIFVRISEPALANPPMIVRLYAGHFLIVLAARTYKLVMFDAATRSAALMPAVIWLAVEAGMLGLWAWFFLKSKAAADFYVRRD